MRRRHILAAALALPVVRASAAEGKTLRMGFQKGEPTQMAAKQNRVLEDILAPRGWAVEWVEFQFGPPMLEAMRVGSIDLGAVGDTPPVFAQAAHAGLVYVSAIRSGSQAILLPPGSGIQALAGLKGKKVAFGRGSSAHNFLIKGLAKGGLTFSDIEPVTLGPADAGAAFQRGAVDAWAIWDPYYALFETRSGVRTLATNADVGEQYSFFIGRSAFVRANPELIGTVLGAFSASCAWIRGHRDEVADLLSNGTGMPPDTMRRVMARVPAEILPLTDAIVLSQQEIANRFRSAGVLPVDIAVADAVWRPGA